MTHYQDIKFIPDAEINLSHILNGFFSKIHIMLVEYAKKDIGVSFPAILGNDEKAFNLGNILRLHGSKENLEEFFKKEAIKAMADYISINAVLPVASSVKEYLLVSRKQVKSSVGRLRRRAMKRHNLSVEEVFKHIPNYAEKKLTLPYIEIQSSSSDQHFKLFIEQRKVKHESCEGTFSFYGLSKTRTVPYF